jgi:hypothetical protein
MSLGARRNVALDSGNGPVNFVLVVFMWNTETDIEAGVR